MASICTSPRTQSKSKGIVTDKSSLEETHNQFSHKASWDSDSIRVFLLLIANEITKGNRPFLVLSQAGYKSLGRKFEKKIGRKHGLKQLKNKYMSLKKEWQVWTKLMGSSKGVSGIRFDCDTGIFQIKKACTKFRKKTLEHRELMETVFMGALATGKHHWTPGEKLAEAADDSSNSMHSLGAQPFADPIPVGVQDMDSDSSLEHVPIEKGKRRKTPSNSVSKSKKATSGASIIVERMNNLTDVVRTKNQQVTVRHLTGNESLYTISKCMHRLTSIPSLVGTPLFHFASTLMDNADLREVLMCQLDDDSIVGWLTQKQLQCTASAPFANLFGSRRM
ncbi:L10-interacting MYB domain-containing protein-like [Camellia sinensis]|uniref:L10-interacting MYB domain-containing protein-like n=1 Tax=Camellia sinensis TaxID=4442 RepID=UPI0010363EFB|nr:L10-interacting MYB domain-containing protein-like [Camellia sinensis]